jgi:hypothetical protein
MTLPPSVSGSELTLWDPMPESLHVCQEEIAQLYDVMQPLELKILQHTILQDFGADSAPGRAIP